MSRRLPQHVRHKPKPIVGVPRLVTYEEASASLGCGPHALRQLIKTGALKTVRVSPRILRISAAELERFAAEGGVAQ